MTKVFGCIGGGAGRIKFLLSSKWIKGVIAILVLIGLFYFNRVNWAQLRLLRDAWPLLLAAFGLMLPPFIIVSYRFQLILRSQGIRVPLSYAIRWTMVGAFFDLVMPSSNGGDVVKAGYVAKHVGAGHRTRAVMAVAFDRILGLLGLFLLAGVAAVIGWKKVNGLQMGPILLFGSFGASVFALIVFRALGSRRLFHSAWLNSLLQESRWGMRIRQFIASFNHLRERPGLLTASLVLSMINHIFWCASLIIISGAVNSNISVIEGFVIFPLAIFGNVLGVAGGFGLGTVGFDLLLSQLLGVGNGALIGLLFQSLSAVSRLSGLPFYIYFHNSDRAVASECYGD